MASALPWDLLPGLNHWGMGVGGEDPTSPKLTTGRGSEAQLFPETHPWGMESGSGTGRWGGGSPCSSPGGVVANAELLPGTAPSPPTTTPFPKSGCAQKQIIQLLRMQPRHLSQPEHLIFYRLKCMQIGPSPREHPQGARGWEQGSESVAARFEAGWGEGGSREVGGSHHKMTSPFFFCLPCSCTGSRWLSAHPPPEDGSLY